MTDKIDLEALAESGLGDSLWVSAVSSDGVIIYECETIGKGDPDEYLKARRIVAHLIYASSSEDINGRARLITAAPELLQRTIAAEKKAQSERERADRAEAEVERLRELLKPVELMELGFQNVREGCVWMLHPEDAPADYDEVVRATLNGESNE